MRELALLPTALYAIAAISLGIAHVSPISAWAQSPASSGEWVWADPREQADDQEKPDDAPAIAPGARVRIASAERGSRPLEGWLESVEGESLLVLPDDSRELVRLPISGISRFEVQTRRNGRRMAGLFGSIVGGVVGLTGGLIIAGNTVDPCSPNAWFCFSGAATATYAMGGAAAGALIGAGIGWLVGSDGWEVVSTERLRATVALGGGGVRVSLRPAP